MHRDLVETIFFQRCSDIAGCGHLLQIGGRNGFAVPLWEPSWTDFDWDQESPDTTNDELREELCYDLNPIERETWVKIIHGQSVLGIAAEERVTRQAIYSRIRGSRRTKGMIHKNFYVARWWKLRETKRLQRGAAFRQRERRAAR